MSRLAAVNQPHSESVRKAVERLLERLDSGRLVALMFVVEDLDEDEPVAGMAGRYRADPAKALGELAVMQTRLSRHIANQRSELDFAETMQ